MAIHERNSERKRLRHTHNRLVHGAIAMRMVFTDYIADDTRRLQVLRIPPISDLVHRIKAAAMNGLQAVTRIRKRTPDDNTHRVVDIVAGHRFLDGNIRQSCCRIRLSGSNARIFDFIAHNYRILYHFWPIFSKGRLEKKLNAATRHVLSPHIEIR